MTVTRAVLVQVAKFHVSVIFCSKVQRITTNIMMISTKMMYLQLFQRDFETITLTIPKSRLRNIEIKERINKNLQF